MAETERHVRLFRNGRNQALRIPREFELPGDEAILRKEGDRLIDVMLTRGQDELVITTRKGYAIRSRPSFLDLSSTTTSKTTSVSPCQ